MCLRDVIATLVSPKALRCYTVEMLLVVKVMCDYINILPNRCVFVFVGISHLLFTTEP